MVPFLNKINKIIDENKLHAVGYSFDPEVEDYLITHYPHIRYYKTYQIERLARK